MPTNNESVSTNLVRQVDTELLETVGVEDLEPCDIEYADKRLFPRRVRERPFSQAAIDPIDELPKVLLVQGLAQRREFVDDLLARARLRHPLATRFDFRSEQRVLERVGRHAEEERGLLERGVRIQVGGGGRRGSGDGGRDLAEVEDRGDDSEQGELFRVVKADRVECALHSHTTRQRSSPSVWNGFMQKDRLTVRVFHSCRSSMPSTSSRECARYSNALIPVCASSVNNNRSVSGKIQVSTQDRCKVRPERFKTQSPLAEQVWVRTAEQLEKDMEAPLVDGSTRDARLFEQVPVDVGARDRTCAVEKDADEFALFRENGLF